MGFLEQCFALLSCWDEKSTCLLEAVFPKTVSKANLTFMPPTPSCTPIVCSSVAPHISLSPLDLSRSLQATSSSITEPHVLSHHASVAFGGCGSPVFAIVVCEISAGCAVHCVAHKTSSMVRTA